MLSSARHISQAVRLRAEHTIDTNPASRIRLATRLWYLEHLALAVLLAVHVRHEVAEALRESVLGVVDLRDVLQLGPCIMGTSEPSLVPRGAVWTPPR